MKKTGSIIEKDIYQLIAAKLRDKINGSVYNSSGRPTDSDKEDAVIIFTTGVDGQIQEGVVAVNIYVPMIETDSGRHVINTKRCRILEYQLQKIMDEAQTTEYELTRRTIIKTFIDEDIKQSFVNAQINFKRLSTN